MKSMATMLSALIALGLLAPGLAAQGTTTGAVAGHVAGPLGGPLSGVRVQLTPMNGGLPVVAETTVNGAFLFPQLEPGEYELLAERLGYRPVVLAPLPVRTARRLDVAVTLVVAEDVVRAPDSVAFPGRALAGGSLPGASRRFGDWERALPQRRSDVGELLRFSTLGEESLEVEGLPGGLGGLAAEGMPFRPAAHAAMPGAPLNALLLPARGVGGAELLVGRPDVEWPGVAGALLSTTAPGRSRGNGGEVGVVGGNEATTPDLEAPPGFLDWRAGASGGGFLVRDSAHLWAFGEAAHHERPVRHWTGRAGSVEQFGESGVDVEGLPGARSGAMDRVSLGGGFDWRFAGGGRVDIVALYGQGERDHLLSGYSGLDVPARIEGRDLLVSATGGGTITEQVGLQLRVGYSQSSREYSTRSVLDTGLEDAAVVFAPGEEQLGGDPALPASSDRGGFTGQATAHIWGGDHHVKLGAGFNLSSYEITHAYARDGIYLFERPADLAARMGVLQGTEGSLATASFFVPEVFVYGQDSWRIAPGLDVSTGLRYEVELLPADDLPPNALWRERTGIDSRQLPGSVGNLGVVAGFDWDVRERHQWRVRGDVAVQVGDVAPELLAEAITHDARITAVGAVGDVSDPTTLGPRLTLLSPGLAPPLTTRGSIGLSRALGDDAAVHLDGVIRQTVNLPARVDLNLPTQAPYTDQYGRPVYGELTRVGALLYPEPGSNRRFVDFDAVTAVSSGASSIYWGVTAALEKRFGHLKAVGSYTYSRTRDDWLAGGVFSALDALPPWRAGEGPGDDWAEGVSDFDVPHRFVLATELTLPFAPVISLGGFWRIESGPPFTPGFGRAIDANGDGVAGNDPAFADETIEGITDLQRGWGCLRISAGRFVERNSCRHENRTLLDAWLALRIPGLAPVAPELRVEALGLDGEGHDSYDTALYILNPDGELSVEEATGQVTVPLRVNPRFGRVTVPVREIARVRISFRMAF